MFYQNKAQQRTISNTIHEALLRVGNMQTDTTQTIASFEIPHMHIYIKKQ